mmetsp:Transcript_42803/g.73036  ORF Transcript_42803/g.73036 Transcript_42803/m.73036 type:complete len:83 (+) Transcript_42803:45-293(+)
MTINSGDLSKVIKLFAISMWDVGEGEKECRAELHIMFIFRSASNLMLRREGQATYAISYVIKYAVLKCGHGRGRIVVCIDNK